MGDEHQYKIDADLARKFYAKLVLYSAKMQQFLYHQKKNFFKHNL